MYSIACSQFLNESVGKQNIKFPDILSTPVQAPTGRRAPKQLECFISFLMLKKVIFSHFYFSFF